MVENVNDVCKSLTLERSYKRKISIRKHHQPLKNTKRRTRRRRSKTRYYMSLKNLRYNRKTDDLCSAVQIFDIKDMEWAPTCSSAALPTEVVEWQKQNQMAYWKSRAISLELENKMLHEHLRYVYRTTIEGHAQNKHLLYNSQENPEQLEESEEGIEENSVNKNSSDKTKYPVIPKEPLGKNRMTEMTAIYGDNKAHKIIGLETSLKLNYEKQKDKLQPAYWPGLPLRLTFE